MHVSEGGSFVSWLYSAPLPLVALIVVLVVLAALEAGHRLARSVPVDAQQIANVSAPILAVVGLLLAFAFGMAGDRHALRRAAAVQEANSIGTFWLRTSFMPEAIRSEMRSRVRRYLDLHFEHRDAGIRVQRLAQIEAEETRLQLELWALLDQEAQRDADAGRLRLVAPALNAMIDDGASALAARENRLPDALLLFLFALVAAAGVVIAYRPRAEKRNLVLWGLFLLVIGGVLMILLDIDRPRRGLIQTDLGPYIRLRESMTE
jgi:hypothetical protein